MSKRSRRAPEAGSMIRVVAVVPISSRRAWQVTEIEENGRQMAALQLMATAPNGSSTPTGHRSVVRQESRGVIDGLIAIEIDLTNRLVLTRKEGGPDL